VGSVFRTSCEHALRRERDRGGRTIGGEVARQDFSKCADVQFYREPLALEANRNVSPLPVTRQVGPGVIFCTLVRNQHRRLRLIN
jgi:hypothetical protein